MESQVDPVNNRMGHVAVVWNDMTLLWGGETNKYWDFWDPTIIQIHQDGIWSPKITKGQSPAPTSYAVAEAINDSLYLVGGHSNNLSNTSYPIKLHNDIYRLDLDTWTWSKLEPKGTKPLKSVCMTSWVSGEKMFLFGGHGLGKEDGNLYPQTLQTMNFEGWSMNNQLVFYDCQNNSWNWPITKGEKPAPCTGHQGLSVRVRHMEANSLQKCWKSYAFIFGGQGIGGDLDRDDLLMLDLDTMRWENIIDTENEGLWPWARSGHSLTMVSKETAILYGGVVNNGEVLGDCWMLNIKKCVSKSKEGNIWTLCGKREHMRGLHVAVQEPSSSRLWLLGGAGTVKQNTIMPTDHISELTFSSNQTLKVLALESVVKHHNRLEPKIKELPTTLQLAVEAKAKRKYIIR